MISATDRERIVRDILEGDDRAIIELAVRAWVEGFTDENAAEWLQDIEKS